MKKDSAARIGLLIASECLSVRVRRLGRLITRIYDAALAPHGVNTAQMNLLAAIAVTGGARAADLTHILEAGKRTRNLADYLKIFQYTLSVMQERDALYRVASELVEDAAKENVRHLEVRYSPILHRQKRLAYDKIVETVIAGLADTGRLLATQYRAFKLRDQQRSRFRRQFAQIVA